MKIIIVIGVFEIGGAERQALLLAKGLQSYGHDVAIWGFGDGILRNQCLDLGIDTRVIGMCWAHDLLSKVISIVAFRRMLKAFSPDILIPFTLVPNIFCALSFGYPSIWNQRDEGVERFSKTIEWFAIRQAKFFVANSTGGARHIKKIARQKKNTDVAIIQNGVSLRSITPDTSEILLCPEKGGGVTFVMVANLSPAKDHETLLKAWQYFFKKNPSQTPNARLILAGRKDASYEKIAGLIELYELADSVMVLGQVKDVPQLLKISDVFVLTSRSEGQSNAVIEAALIGLPILGSNIEGISSCIPPLSREMLTRNGDFESLASRFQDLYGDEAKRHALGRENSIWASEVFSVTGMVSSYNNLISEVINKSKPQ